jgi:hypothetical protein
MCRVSRLLGGEPRKRTETESCEDNNRTISCVAPRTYSPIEDLLGLDILITSSRSHDGRKGT